MKRCPKCGETKPLDSFAYHKNYTTKDKRQSYCKPCQYVISEKSRIMRTYGITVDEYQKMVEAQQHRCAICGQEENDAIKKRLSIDHSHNDKQIRGLLCSKCNLGIGNFDDDVNRLRSAIAYLDRFRRKPIYRLVK
jgi:hypothetical protein